MPRWHWLWPVCAALAVSSFIGCAPPCATVDEEAISFQDGRTNANNTFFETSEIDGQYLHFPAGRRFDIAHKLVAKPTEVHTYLSFQERPLPNSNFSESAGNQAVIEAVDGEIVRVFNDTCAEFYLRLTASTDPTMGSDAGVTSDAGTSDAPSDAPAD